MPEIVVPAESRGETGKNANRRLRGRGLIPGVVYGDKKKTVPVAVSPKAISDILLSATGENTLFDLDLGGSRRRVILKEYQVEPLKGDLLHADFYELALDKTLELQVPVELVGTPVGVKVEGGILDFVARELTVECLPRDIPEKIVVDVSHLGLGKHVRVSDVTVPEKITILSDRDLVIAHVVAPRAEEAPAAPAAEVAAEAAPAEPEVIKKGKTTAEGEAAQDSAEKPEKAERPERREKEKK
jgi:large subunit ribosomal protein L25